MESGTQDSVIPIILAKALIIQYFNEEYNMIFMYYYCLQSPELFQQPPANTNNTRTRLLPFQ